MAWHCFASAQVAIAGMRCGGHHSECHQRFLGALGHLEAFDYRLLEGRNWMHDVVGRYDRNGRLGVAGREHGRRPGHCIERVATFGLAKDVRRLQLG